MRSLNDVITFIVSFQVDFETFKEAFVMVLSSAVDIDGIEAGTDIDQEYSMGSFPNSGEGILQHLN